LVSLFELHRFELFDLSLKDLVDFRLELKGNVCSAKRTSSFFLQKLIAALYAVLVIAEWLELARLYHQVVAYVAVELSH